MGDSKNADWAIRELGKKQNKPFFLVCGFYRPHLPWYVPRNLFYLYHADMTYYQFFVSD